MKGKIKRFFTEKKELLIFIGVVAFVFAAVIGIASIALNSSNNTEAPAPSEPEPSTPVTPEPTLPNEDEPVVVENVFTLPVEGEYVITRAYFDSSLTAEEAVAAMINTGSSFITSKGISYSKEDNSVFDVLAINDGTVLSVDTTDELVGSIVTIKHSDDLVSVYSSLSDVTVKEGDSITCGQAIAKASTSINDVKAGVHVHLEVKQANSFINPDSIIGKKISEMTEEK